MDLTPANLAAAGYVPLPPDTASKVPQMRALSTNACPNSSPTWLSDPPGACPEYGLTSWGYCCPCWEAGLVPAVWAARVDASIGGTR